GRVPRPWSCASPRALALAPRRSGEWANGSSFHGAMSGAASRCSSGAAEAVEEPLLAGEDARDIGLLRSRIPFIELERAAEDDAIRPREHVTEVAERSILDLGLRLEDRELAAGRVHVL